MSKPDETPPEQQLTETVAVRPGESPGERVGPYRILERLGEGGMGVVHLAEQTEPVQRRVALKQIKLGMDTRQVIGRFESERQALALMNHPNVARVYDAGATDQGRPYFAMEYVRGESITGYCDRHRLNTRERLELFMKVCDGVQHAHQKGIIHRDIKPSNVLVTLQDNRPVPKIIDFGVAKATERRLTERTVYTQQGVMIGTPEYMSPEQAEMTGLDIDTRTDVYSLGVMLYELLVGALPFDTGDLRKAGIDEIRRRIREDEPSRPSTRISTLGDAASTEAARRRRTDLMTLRKQLRGDLDWITMRALEKNRARRYGSPSEIADDIRRHLKHEPVLAGPPGTAYRMGKFVRRHTVGVVFAATLAALLIAFGVAMSVLYARQLEAQRLAEGRRAEAEQARDEAEAVTGFLSDMLAAVSPVKQGVDVKVREVLDQASGEIAERFEDQPIIEARLRDTIGDSYYALGLSDAAETHLRAALELHRGAFGNDHEQVLDSIHSLQGVLFDQGRHDEAEQLSRERIGILGRMFGPDDLRLRLAEATHAQILQRKSDSETAERETMDMALTFVLNVMDPQLYDPDLADTIRQTRGIAKDKGRDEARLFLTDYWRVTTARIADLANTGRLDAARAEVRRHFEPLLANPFFRANIPMMMFANADYLALRGNLAAAKVFARDALGLLRDQHDNEHIYVSYALVELGRLLKRTGELTEAESLLREAADMQRRLLGGEHPQLAGTLISLGGLLRAREDHAGAEHAFREALTIRRVAKPPDPKLISSSLMNVGSCLLAQQRYAEAETVLVECVELREKALPEGDWRTAEALGALGESVAGQGKFAEAERALVEAYERLIEAAETIPASRSTLLLDSVGRIVALYESWGDAEKAADWRARLPEADEG